MIILWLLIVVIVLFGFVVFFGAPYVPTLRKELRVAFEELYPVGKNDVVVDLGAGDGRVLQATTSKGARGYGVELNPLLALIARLRIGKHTTIYCTNMWTYQLPKDVTLVYIFSVSRDAKKLQAYLQQQADTLGKPFNVMTFGAKLTSITATARLGAHNLYTIMPSQPKKHKV